jgi:uncharacterized protein
MLAGAMADLPPDLLALLRCPVCRGELEVEAQALRCDACGLRYRVEDGVPNMLAEQAERVGETPAG